MLLEEYFWGAELLEKNVCGLDPVGVRIEWGLCKQNRMLLGDNLELVKDVPPKSFHIVPIGDDAVLNGVIQFKNTLVLLSCVSDEDLIIVLRDHDFLINGSSNTIMGSDH